ncbi:MAG: fibronectin type III domain-containing protein, partial [Acetobacteraceae bacterium]|nr:fibronectin type III domain-containing protein [Acetobacteraceae bacterium]
MPDNSAYLSSPQNSGTAGGQATFNYGRQIWCCWNQGGADVGSRTAFQAALGGSTNLNITRPATPGTYMLNAYDAQTGGNLLAQGGPVTVTAAPTITLNNPGNETASTGFTVTGSLSGYASQPTLTLLSGGTALTGVTFTFSGLTGFSATVPGQSAGTLALSVQDATNNVQSNTVSVTVAAAPDVVLTGLPASIAAGQPLSGVTFTLNNEAYGDFILWDVTAGAQDDAGFVIASSVTPDSSLDFLVPQNGGHEYQVQLITPGSSPPSVIWQSATFNVTAAPGALPAQIASFTTSNVTTTGLTLNWPAVSGATGYKVLARTTTGQKWGSLADTTVSGTSYAFTGLPAGGTVYAIVSPINANGQGPGFETIQS